MYLDKSLLVSLVGSGVVAAIVAGLVTLRTNARNIKVANVTAERAKWRDKIRALARDIHSAIAERKSLGELHSQLALNLNPYDKEDRQILRLVERLPEQGATEATLREFTQRISLLLKHDWDRAKWESSSIIRRILSGHPFCPKERVRFEDFRREQD
jgi:hypothetical protein